MYIVQQNNSSLNCITFIQKGIDKKLPEVKVWSDFKPFAQTVIDQTETLNQIPSYINIFRKEKSYWDAAFHLYSGIILTKNAALETPQADNPN